MAVPDWLYIIGVMCALVWLISLILVIINCVTGFANKKSLIFLSLLVLSYIGIAIVCICDDIILTKPTGEYEYKVTINDSVSMNEFQERYEIVDVEG